MKYQPANRKYFEYTDDFLEKAKWFRLMTAIKLIMIFGLMFIVTNIKWPNVSFKLDALIDLFVIFVFLIIIFRTLNELQREYSADEIYITDGVLYFMKGVKTRFGTGSFHHKVNNITNVTVTKSKVIIYGKIIKNFGKVDLTFKKLVLPAAIKNVDELIEFARTKADGRSK